VPSGPPTQVVEMGFATELHEWSSGYWEVVAHDVQYWMAELGSHSFWALARCFEAVDRLVSAAQLLALNLEHIKLPVANTRNHLTLMWLASGMMKELATAIHDLRPVRKRLTGEDLKAWYCLEGISQRWKSAPFKRVRNSLAFHLDDRHELSRRGIDEVLARGRPLLLCKGDELAAGSASFCFGSEIMVYGLWEDPQTRMTEIEAFGRRLVRDQIGAARHLQRVLFGILQSQPSVTADSQLSRRRRALLDLLRRRAGSV
jgi:hypothetical protein